MIINVIGWFCFILACFIQFVLFVGMFRKKMDSEDRLAARDGHKTTALLLIVTAICFK